MPEIEGFDYTSKTYSIFIKRMVNQAQPIRKALMDENAKDWMFAQNDQELIGVLKRAGININEIQDPWGSPYYFSFDTSCRYRSIAISSSGPDKQRDTDDDIRAVSADWDYFKPYAAILDRVAKESYASTGKFFNGFDDLNAVLAQNGLDFAKIRNPWGNLYNFHFSFSPHSATYLINVVSPCPTWKDCTILTISIDYFERNRVIIEDALHKYFRSSHVFPIDDESFNKALAGSGLRFRNLVDPWNHPYYAQFSLEPDYSDNEIITEWPEGRTQSAQPVTLYDYYNPDSRVALPPVEFTIHRP